MIITPTLNTDYYKECHWQQYDQNISKITSYFTPRMSRTNEKYLIMFGLQYYIKEYLIKQFNEHFFKCDKELVIKKYSRMMINTLSKNDNAERWGKLWDLGYLPLKISALVEGTRCPIGCPMIEISNTHPDFAWLVNFIETPMSCTLWHAMASANVGYIYRQIVNKYFDLTVDDNIPRHIAIGDYSMRGQESIESAAKSSAAFLLSFTKTATIPAIEFLEEYYNCNIETELVGSGAIGTEHSVMCSSFAIDGDEITQVLRLINEIYPNDNFTIVADSYDFWYFLSHILSNREVRSAIIKHAERGYFVGIRPDSGNPVNILCGDESYEIDSLERKGLVEILDDIYGHTINSKGYKVLYKGIKAIYGDSITHSRAKEIYKNLMKKRYASNNVLLGCGSFSMQSVDGKYPLTRDTYSVAIKTTHIEMKDGTEFHVFKQPKTDTGNFKTSHRGLCHVSKADNSSDDTIIFCDRLYNNDINKIINDMQIKNLIVPVFLNGNIINEQTLKEIRVRLHNTF